MTDDVSLRAAHAERIRNDPMVKEALEQIESALMRGWRDSRADDAQERERLYNVYLGLQAFRRFFDATVDAGKVAEHNLQQLRRGQF
jgi:hypothetical protein